MYRFQKQFEMQVRDKSSGKLYLSLLVLSVSICLGYNFPMLLITLFNNG